jgi:diguanylate cyclase (GGDEF)-like protein
VAANHRRRSRNRTARLQGRFPPLAPTRSRVRRDRHVAFGRGDVGQEPILSQPSLTNINKVLLPTNPLDHLRATLRVREQKQLAACFCWLIGTFTRVASWLVAFDGSMKLVIITHGDALRHTARRVGIAVCLTAALTLLMIGITFGTDPETNVRLSNVAVHGIIIGTVIAALLAGALTYRSALLMQELNLARAELLRISQTDQLTGLLNRRGYNEAALSALAKASGTKFPAVALMCDIDRFKAINDQFGHEFGDKVLIEISDAIRSFGEKNGMLVARHGGEEFAALMIGVTAEQAIRHAEELRRICASKEILSDDGARASVTVSIGLASSRQNSYLPDLMRTADRALYAAKHDGRNRVVRADVRAGTVAA